MKSKILLGALLASITLLGCSSVPAETGGGAFPEAPYVTLASDAAALQIEVRTSPQQPPSRGSVDVELTVTDADGNPRDDLAITASPWMPAMAHGASTKPIVEAQGQGRYLISK